MKFYIKFTAGYSTPYPYDDSSYGLKDLDNMRAKFGPHVTDVVAGRWTEASITMTEEECRSLCAAPFAHCTKITVKVPVMSMDGYCVTVPSESNGVVTMSRQVDMPAAIKAWVAAGAPAEWDPAIDIDIHME